MLNNITPTNDDDEDFLKKRSVIYYKTSQTIISALSFIKESLDDIDILTPENILEFYSPFELSTLYLILLKLRQENKEFVCKNNEKTWHGFLIPKCQSISDNEQIKNYKCYHRSKEKLVLSCVFCDNIIKFPYENIILLLKSIKKSYIEKNDNYDIIT